MALFQPPPTVIMPDGTAGQWDAVWIKYWNELINTLNTSVGGSSGATIAIDVFSSRGLPGTGLFQPTAEMVQALRSFAPQIVQVSQSGDSQSILATQVFGA